MSEAGISTGFPIFDQPFVDENRMITPAWRMLLLTLWNRTGNAGGIDAIIALLESALSAPSGGVFSERSLGISSLDSSVGQGSGVGAGAGANALEALLGLSGPGKITLTGDVTGSGVNEILTAIAASVLNAGTYVPTITGVANITATTAYSLGFIRIRKKVFVFGRIDIQPNVATTFTKIRFSLPFASVLVNSSELAGVAINVNASPLPAVIFGDVANGEAALGYTCTADVSAIGFFFTFGYQILP